MNFRQRTEELRTFLRHGDIDAICRDAKCSETLLRKAFKAESYSDLSPTEKRAYMTFMQYAKRRKYEREKEDRQFEKKAAKITAS